MRLKQLWFPAIVLIFTQFGVVRGQNVEIEINDTPEVNDDYVTWAPTAARARLATPQGSAVDIVLTNDPATGGLPTGGDVRFANGTLAAGVAPTAPASETLALTLSADGSWSPFLIAGWFQRPSSLDRDCVIIAHNQTPTGSELGRKELMVRIRKNALVLTIGERDRFLSAIKKLRDSGKYRIFQEIHRQASREAHGGPAFVAWHRFFILQYERELQKEEPSVALPYWQFDRPAVHATTSFSLFATSFMGSNAVATTGNPFFQPAVSVQFHSSNPLAGWTTDLNPAGVGAPPGATNLRRRQFDRRQTPVELTSTGASLPLPGDLDVVSGTTFEEFTSLEGSPHGSAHVWGGGSVGAISTAVEDPLFFMLHCNVDRLWAQWQRLGPAASPRYGSGASGYMPQLPRSFPAPPPVAFSAPHIGHYLEDEMWPWIGGMGTGGSGIGDRPVNAPGGPFPLVPGLAPASDKPRPIDAIDYAGRLDSSANLGYGYDDDSFSIP